MFYLLFIFFLFTPLAAMESVPEPIREPEMNLPLDMRNDIEENETVLFDGSRRFYDNETFNRSKKNAYKQCLKKTTIHSALSGVFNFALIVSINMLASAIANDPINDSYSKILRLSLAESSIFIGIYLIYFSIFNWNREVQPITKKYNPFREYNINCCSNHQLCLSKPFPVIPEPLIDAADNSKLIRSPKKFILRLYQYSGNLFGCLYFDRLRRLFLSKKDFELFSITKKILKNSSPTLREEYRNIAYQVKKVLTTDFPQHIVKRIFQEFPNCNILAHVLAHQTKKNLKKQFCYMPEQDLLALSKKNGPFKWEKADSYPVKPCLVASILAANGWIAFSPNEKYPIQCNMKYFDEAAMPNDMKYYYTEMDISPTIYLPYNLQLARYYKFEDDPTYKIEQVAPTNRQIKRLLQLRQEIIGRNPVLLQPIQNNNNQG